eukprot:10372363-Ditylum_brightwellii.AAC.2
MSILQMMKYVHHCCQHGALTHLWRFRVNFNGAWGRQRNCAIGAVGCICIASWARLFIVQCLWCVAHCVGYTWMRDNFITCIQVLLCTDEGEFVLSASRRCCGEFLCSISKR